MRTVTHSSPAAPDLSGLERRAPSDPTFDVSKIDLTAVSIPDDPNAPPAVQEPQEMPKPPETAGDTETTLADTDSRYFGVHSMLPSHMSFYNYMYMSVRPYQLAEKYKLGAATKSGQLRFVVEAVGACIDRPVAGLALMDFWYICYWLRLQSYTSSPFTVNWVCEDLKHLQQALLEEVDEKTRVNQTVIRQSDIQVKPLQIDQLSGIANRLAVHGVYLQLPTVADFLERIEHGADWHPEFSFKADIAVFLRQDQHGKTVAHRVAWLDKLVANPNAQEIMGDILRARELLDQGGVVESVKAGCKHCKVEQTVSLEVDLLTFFPFGI